MSTWLSGWYPLVFHEIGPENRVDNSIRPNEGRYGFSLCAFFAGRRGGWGVAGKSGPFYEELHSKALGDPNPRLAPPQLKMYS